MCVIVPYLLCLIASYLLSLNIFIVSDCAIFTVFDWTIFIVFDWTIFIYCVGLGLSLPCLLCLAVHNVLYCAILCYALQRKVPRTRSVDKSTNIANTERGPELPNNQAASANQSLTNIISREKPEDWRPCFTHKLKHSDRATDWWTPKKTFYQTVLSHVY